MAYAGLWFGLFAFSAGLTCVIGPNVLSILVFPVPLGVYAARRAWPQALGLVGCAAASGTVGIVGFGLLAYAVGALAKEPLTAGQAADIIVKTFLNYGLLAASGLVIGAGIGRGWTYGRVVTVTSAAVFSALSAYMAWNWAELNTQLDGLFQFFVDSLQAKSEQAETPVSHEQIEALAYWKQHKTGLLVGFQFAVILATSCMFVSLTASALRRWFADPGPVGSFRDMRPPEWLVWIVIATALLWFGERQFGSAELQFVSWNMAVGLSAIYFLNGFAVFLYGIQILAPGFIVMALIVLLVVNVGLFPVLSMLGLFDTWGNFRVRIDRLAQAIRDAKSSDDSL